MQVIFDRLIHRKRLVLRILVHVLGRIGIAHPVELMYQAEHVLDLLVGSSRVFAPGELLVSDRCLLLDRVAQACEDVLAVLDLLGSHVIAGVDGPLLLLLQDHHLVERRLLMADHVFEREAQFRRTVPELWHDWAADAAKGCDANLVEWVALVNHAIDEWLAAIGAIFRDKELQYVHLPG